MNDHLTISLVQLFEMFPDNETARQYLESRLWPQGVRCPECKHGERVTTRKGGYYRCNSCRLDFTVRTGTIFERSHVPLHKWLHAMYMLVTARKGISSLQLAKELGVTQKSAWFLLHRLREAIGKDLEKLRGEVEIDETFVGGLESNKHATSKKHLKRYVNEFVFRLNAGNVKRHTLERLNSFIDAAVGTRITYEGLTA